MYIKSIDRLGRNYREILEQRRVLTKEKGVNIVLQVLSFVAENERVNIRQRQAEGIAAAKKRGVRFGRPPRPLPKSFPAAYRRWKAKKITGTAAAKECGMALSTFRYRAAMYKNRHCYKGDFCKNVYFSAKQKSHRQNSWINGKTVH